MIRYIVENTRKLPVKMRGTSKLVLIGAQALVFNKTVFVYFGEPCGKYIH